MLLLDDPCLVFSALPFSAVRLRYAGEFISSRTLPVPIISNTYVFVLWIERSGDV